MALLKSQMSFSKRQKILKCLWSKNFELQKCGHTGKIKLRAKFVNHFDVFDNYGVEKSQCDCSTRLLCLSQFQLGTSPPGQPPRISSKRLRGPGIRQGRGFVETESETFCPSIGFISDK